MATGQLIDGVWVRPPALAHAGYTTLGQSTALYDQTLVASDGSRIYAVPYENPADIAARAAHAEWERYRAFQLALERDAAARGPMTTLGYDGPRIYAQTFDPAREDPAMYWSAADVAPGAFQPLAAQLAAQGTRVAYPYRVLGDGARNEILRAVRPDIRYI